MNTKMLTKLALMASVAIVMSACTNGTMRPYGARASKPKNPAPKVQLLDECPEADGTWRLDGGTTLVLSRKEGFLTLQHPDLTEALVFDGKARKIQQTVTGLTPEITASCKNKLVLITYKFESKTVGQSWTFDLEKDSIGITEMNGLTLNKIAGSRVYSSPAASQGANPPSGQ